MNLDGPPSWEHTCAGCGEVLLANPQLKQRARRPGPFLAGTRCSGCGQDYLWSFDNEGRIHVRPCSPETIQTLVELNG